jgi:hypothetical protein
MTLNTIQDLVNEKTRLTKLIKVSWENIYQYNSVLKVTTATPKHPVDVNKEYEDILKYEAELIDVKLKINAYNMGISSLSIKSLINLHGSNYYQIYLRSAINERAGYLAHLRIKEGKIWDRYLKKAHTWHSVITKQRVIDEVKILRDKIDSIDKHIQMFNNKAL